MKTKHSILLICIITLGCINKAKEKNTGIVYNETTLKEFVTTSRNINKTDAAHKVDSILNAASNDSTTFHQTISYLEKPFANPNSIYRNEELYTQLLKAKINSPWYNSSSKATARSQLYLHMQNRPGTKANDFSYLTTSGIKKRMYDLHAKFTLLYFYNPECQACKEMRVALTNSAVIKEKVASGALNVLAIYIDNDEKLWLHHLNEMPTNWIHGRDDNEYLFKNNVYDLKAIPTVYLLDKHKNVLLKDCMDIVLIEQKINPTE